VVDDVGVGRVVGLRSRAWATRFAQEQDSALGRAPEDGVDRVTVKMCRDEEPSKFEVVVRAKLTGAYSGSLGLTTVCRSSESRERLPSFLPSPTALITEQGSRDATRLYGQTMSPLHVHGKRTINYISKKTLRP
jgi:hypothetical protein